MVGRWRTDLRFETESTGSALIAMILASLPHLEVEAGEVEERIEARSLRARELGRRLIATDQRKGSALSGHIALHTRR